ncbi:MAG: GntR family transcriptional regulator [Dehalococcoidia bacterium]
MSGNIRAGDTLRQEEVAARLGVSQTPVREAFRRLESEGWWSTRRTGASSCGIPWTPPPRP